MQPLRMVSVLISSWQHLVGVSFSSFSVEEPEQAQAQLISAKRGTISTQITQTKKALCLRHRIVPVPFFHLVAQQAQAQGPGIGTAAGTVPGTGTGGWGRLGTGPCTGTGCSVAIAMASCFRYGNWKCILAVILFICLYFVQINFLKSTHDSKYCQLEVVG